MATSIILKTFGAEISYIVVNDTVRPFSMSLRNQFLVLVIQLNFMRQKQNFFSVLSKNS